ncbi:EF-hand calcium-binding domain-containing protein 12 isoform X1 [Mobula birostris]|uniref:EF-hand calcium-binding domain-containing protein 12 isoform X1 n=1 Tax=Mobula birostris TaxID=1983395 RepID=UPI003B282450
MAVKTFGPPRSRKRVITAVPTPPRYRARSWPETVPLSELSEERSPGREPDTDYALYLAMKRRQRADLEAMADVKSWLNSKLAATDLELRVLERLERRSEAGEPGPEPKQHPKTQKNTSRKVYDKPSSINLPSLEPVKLLHEYLIKKRLRFVDFFRSNDRGMKGKLSKDDLLVAFKKVNLPITDLQMNELTETLGDHTNHIGYKVLAQALNAWKEELRQENRNKHFKKAPVNSLQKIPVSTNLVNATASIAQDGNVPRSPHEFKVQAVNLRESRPFTAEELEQREPRNQDRSRMLKNNQLQEDLMEKCLHTRGVEHSIACHSLTTTMEGEMGEAANTFYKQCLKDYRRTLKICQLHDIALTENMLVKALLHPGDLEQSLKQRQSRTGVVSDNTKKQRLSTRQPRRENRGKEF